MQFSQSEVKAIKKFLDWGLKQDISLEEKYCLKNFLFLFKEAEKNLEKKDNQILKPLNEKDKNNNLER